MSCSAPRDDDQTPGQVESSSRVLNVRRMVSCERWELAKRMTRTMIVIAVAVTELAVIVYRPASWELAAFALTTVLFAFQHLSGQPRRTAERNEDASPTRAPAARFPRVRISVRGTMIAVACMAIVLSPVHHWLQMPFYEERANYHGLMANLCEYETALMRKRADACSVLAKSGAPWDDPGEEAEVLKCCPYSSDAPRYGSWSEQAAVWERAASRSTRCAQRHSRMCDYCRGWSPIAPW